MEKIQKAYKMFSFHEEIQFKCSMNLKSASTCGLLLLPEHKVSSMPEVKG